MTPLQIGLPLNNTLWKFIHQEMKMNLFSQIRIAYKSFHSLNIYTLFPCIPLQPEELRSHESSVTILFSQVSIDSLLISLSISIGSSDPSFTSSHSIILLISYISFLLLASCLIYLILSLLSLILVYIPHLSFH